MSTEYFRFRRIDRLLGEDGELEKQEIYFSDPASLNDPLEGFRDVFWEGDKVVWKNLFRHYLRCVEHVYMLLLVDGEEHKITDDHVPMHIQVDSFPTDLYRDLFSKMYEEFVADEFISDLTARISKRKTPVRRSELLFYLESVHIAALHYVRKTYAERGLSRQKSEPSFYDSNQLKAEICEKLSTALEVQMEGSEHPDATACDLFSAHSHVREQMRLIAKFNGVFPAEKKNAEYLISEFPGKYISLLERLVFPPWYTACFISDFSNSSVWGHYAENHSGACLIFNSESDNGNDYLPLRGVNGFGSTGDSYGTLKLDFQKIDYVTGYGEIDFFRSLGNLSVSTINSSWYMDDGVFSECANEIRENEAQWRNRYWSDFYRDIVKKSKDWEYEKESRLILSSTVNLYEEKEKRKLTYEFRFLSGIIFGIKTSFDDKVQIMRVIEKKCAEHGRDDFEFYQAFYDPERKCISRTKLGLVRYTNSSIKQH